jgi:Na+-driven multidrug efflux pump
MVAQLSGADRKDEVSKLMGTLLVTFTATAVVLTAVVLIFTLPILHLLDTPEIALRDTVYYLRICMLGTVFVYVYNFLCAVLRGLGDSKTPILRLK